jgi:hypothetical protein
MKEDSVADLEESQFRLAGPADAKAVAIPHADSWRRHYRGAYSDTFLDGDVIADRLAVWTDRLREPDPRRYTILAKDGSLVGFANTLFDDDPTWGRCSSHLARRAARFLVACAERGGQGSLSLVRPSSS